MKVAILSVAVLIFAANATLTAAPALPASARRPTVAQLKTAMTLPVIINGKASGWVNAPAGAQVNILKVSKDKVLIGMSDSQLWVKRTDTDFDQRLAAFKSTKQDAQAKLLKDRLADNTAFEKQKAQNASDFARKNAESGPNPLDRGAYDQTRSVVDYYDRWGRRYHIGVFGQRIYD